MLLSKIFNTGLTLEELKELKKLNVLFVEDELRVANSMIKLLSIFFNKVIHCENGRLGLEEYHSNKNNYNLIITDLRMPVMNGIDMIKEIKNIDKSVPVYITSGDSELINQAEELKVNNFFDKPVDIQQIFKIILEDFS